MSATSVLPSFVIELLTKIAITEGFQDFYTETKPHGSPADGSFGTLSSVTITGPRHLNDVETIDQLHLVCKLIPDDATRRRELNIDKFFEREAAMYNKVIPLLAQFQREKSLPADEYFVTYPKCYAAIADAEKDQYAIIMEDLKVKGFEMWPKRRPAPPDHLKRVLEELAKMHSVSFALRDQQPDVFEELKQYQDFFGPILDKGMRKKLNESYARAIDVLEKEEHIEMLKQLRSNSNDCFQNSIAVDGFGVLGHGDAWINNIMFKYGTGVS